MKSTITVTISANMTQEELRRIFLVVEDTLIHKMECATPEIKPDIQISVN